jgi:hemoglobin
MSEQARTLYARLGGYDAIAAVANDLLPRLRNDPQLGRFWKNRAEDSITREKQLLIDYLCACRRSNVLSGT